MTNELDSMCGVSDEELTERFKEAKSLLDYGFANFEIYTPMIDENSITEVKVSKGQVQSFMPLHANPSKILIPKGQGINITQIAEISESVEAPVEKGQTVGKITFKLNDEPICTVNLTSCEEIPKVTFSYAFSRLLSSLIN